MVLRCPSTSKAVSEQAKLLGCNDTYRYHCLKTEDGDLIEKCLDISWIQKGNCAIFNSNAQQLDAVRCNENLGICPQKQYLSNEVMSYSACVQAPDVHVSSFVPTENIKGESITTLKPPSDVSDVQPWIIVLIAVAVLLAVIVAIVVIYITINKRRKRSSDSKLHDEEMSPLQSLTESKEGPSSEKDRKGYDMVPFYKTKRYEYLEQRLINSSVSIIVVGEPGSGKSVLGEMLYIRFWTCEINGKHYKARYLSEKRLRDIDNYQSDHNTKTVNIFDNSFEVWNQYPHLITPNFEQIQCFHEKVVKGEGNCLVITFSKMNFENNLDAAQRAQLQRTDQLEIVDLTSADFQLDITDKIGILEYHRKKNVPMARRVDDMTLRKLTASIANYTCQSSRLEFEFPLLCHLYYKHNTFEDNKEMFFTITKKIIKEFVQGLSTGSHEEKCQYCTLIYITLCGGQIETKKKQDDTLLKAIAKQTGIDTSQLEFNYGCCLITEGATDNSYKIIHEEISKFLFSVFCERHAGMVIDTCEVEVLMKFLRTDDKCRRSVYRKMGFLIITHNLYDCLAARLQVYNIDQRHAIFRDSGFCKQFRKEGSGTDAEKAECAKETTNECSHQENAVSSCVLPK